MRTGRMTCRSTTNHTKEEKTKAARGPAGFGPERPWGLVFLRGARASMGVPDQWYPTLEAFVRLLRLKVDTREPKLIQTVRGIGYTMRDK